MDSATKPADAESQPADKFSNRGNSAGALTSRDAAIRFAGFQLTIRQMSDAESDGISSSTNLSRTALRRATPPARWNSEPVYGWRAVERQGD